MTTKHEELARMSARTMKRNGGCWGTKLPKSINAADVVKAAQAIAAREGLVPCAWRESLLRAHAAAYLVRLASVEGQGNAVYSRVYAPAGLVAAAVEGTLDQRREAVKAWLASRKVRT